jgi:hypothetical protein
MTPKRRRKARVAVRRETGSSDAHRQKTFSPAGEDAGTRRSSRRIVSAVPHIIIIITAPHRRSVESAPAHGRTHSRAMALVLRGARAAGVLKQVATAPLAQVRPRGSRGPRCRRHRRVRSRSRAQPVCSYDRVSVDARLTPRPTPTRTQANAARGFSVTTAGRAGMGSPVPAHEPPTGPVRTEVERRCAIEDIIPKPQPA